MNCDIDLNDILLAVIGDMNARTAELNEFIPKTHVPADLEEFNDILCSQIDTRVSCDKVSNK